MKKYEILTITDGAEKWETLKATDGDVISWIPMAEGNRDYQAYLAWVAEGNEAEESEV
jgi:hypothetical protein